MNYRTQDFVEEAKRWTGKRGVDIVIEHIGGDTFERSAYALTRLGTLVTIGSHDTHWGRLDLRHVYSKNLRILGTNLGSILELGPSSSGWSTKAHVEPIAPSMSVFRLEWAARRPARPSTEGASGSVGSSSWLLLGPGCSSARRSGGRGRRRWSKAGAPGSPAAGLARGRPRRSATDWSSLGVGKGNHVLIALKNRLEHVLAYWALRYWARRRPRLPSKFHLLERGEFRYIIEDFGPACGHPRIGDGSGRAGGSGRRAGAADLRGRRAGAGRNAPRSASCSRRVPRRRSITRRPRTICP